MEKNSICIRPTLTALMFSWLLISPSSVQAAPPDLTQPGAIATIDRSGSYNLGPTGMRGWIFIGGKAGSTPGEDGTMTDESRQILVTASSAPAADHDLLVNDVILGAIAANSGDVPLFASDCRKAFGLAIGDAEKTGAGTLRVKRWRAGATADVNIPLITIGNYEDTAPYDCPKSTQILANARNHMVNQLIANPNFLNPNYYSGAINGLALLSAVQPGDPDSDKVQSRLQAFARSMATGGPQNIALGVWTWAYCEIFLSEYYLSTGDADVLPGINQFALKLAKSQSIYGTFGHNPAVPRTDGSGRLSVDGYGPVNGAGLSANLGIVMGKKALVAGNQKIDSQIDVAIQRGSDFFAWYTNKGSIPYGEHQPGATNHASNGKDQMAAVFFSQLDGRLTESEYFTRMSIAGFPGREYGHTGQGFSYLWEGMAVNAGGPLAAAEYLKKVRWHLDLSRRTDGSFVYDGGEQYGPGKTADGTYLGASSYNDMNPTACYLLTYSLPLKRLCITGKNANPKQALNSTKVANAIAAATYKFDRSSRTTTQLIGDISEFDPVMRNYAARELATRTLTTTELNTLRTMLGGSNINGRMGSCQTLGLLKDIAALPMITQHLNQTVESDPWVRATAASALREYGNTANTQIIPMLTAFASNATDPDTIVWSDPLQASNSCLSYALFGDVIGGGNNFSSSTKSAPKSLLYPAVKAAISQPDSASRFGAACFAFENLTIDDVRAMPVDFINLTRNETQCDLMWSCASRSAGIRTLNKYHFHETMTEAMNLLDPAGFKWGSQDYIVPSLDSLAGFGDAARWTLPVLQGYLERWDPTAGVYNSLVKNITAIDAAATTPSDITYLKSAANPQIVTTTGSKAINLTGSSCRDGFIKFTVLTQPAHGKLTGTAPNLTYTPTKGYAGPDQFTFQTADALTTSAPATVGIVVGPAGTGLKGEYFDNADFSNPKITRTDAQIHFDWGTGSPDASIGADTFSVRWSGLLLVPETGTYTFSTLTSDGARLYINGAPVIDNFVAQNSKWVDGTPIQLTAGEMVEIQMEYYDNTDSAVAKLKWTGSSVAGQGGAIIPQAYLFDGSGITKRKSYANSQKVSMIQNTSQSITLAGCGGNLTYTVLTQPNHGTLSGKAPSLTYTPATNYSGPDSFTFLVKNSTGNSSPATVSISISAGLPVTYTWKNPADGTMSNAANWVSDTAPAATGLTNGNLNLAQTGTYTITHDLGSEFLLNQLDAAGSVTFAGSNAFKFVANGSILPQFNQNSSNGLTVNIPIHLDAMTTLGGNYGGTVTLTNLISGKGGMVKTSPGTLQINNFNNTYSGGTILNNGSVMCLTASGGPTPIFGTGPLTINRNATLTVNRTFLPNAVMLNGGKITGGNSFGSAFMGSVTLTGISTFDFGSTGGFGITGNITGTGGFTTVGTTEWALSGTNTYTGPTTIQAGAILYQAATAVAPGALIISTGGRVNLNYTGDSIVTSLTLGGAAMPPGTYGSSASPATNKNDTWFTKTSVGTITVPAPTTPSRK